MALRLTAGNHLDCCIIMNALTEHRRLQTDRYQLYINSLLTGNDGKTPEQLKEVDAKVCEICKYRNDVTSCCDKALRRLTKLRKIFEAEMEFDSIKS